MPKPIVVLYLPWADSFGFDLTPGDLMAMLNDNDERRKMAPMFYDYLWFVFVDNSLNTPKLQVFHEKDYIEAQYDDLKKMLEEGINSLKTKQNE